jgi:hypothetical protein
MCTKFAKKNLDVQSTNSALCHQEAASQKLEHRNHSSQHAGLKKDWTDLRRDEHQDEAKAMHGPVHVREWCWRYNSSLPKEAEVAMTVAVCIVLSNTLKQTMLQPADWVTGSLLP